MSKKLPLDFEGGAFWQRQNLPDVIADALRRAIINGRLEPGQQLPQNKLAEQFKVSSIPVREALRQLEAEGLTNYSPNQGFEVSTLSADEARELFEIRSVLETLALCKAIPNLTEEDFQEATAILTEMDEEKDVHRLGVLNQRFHMTLLSPAAQPRLLSILETLHGNVDRFMCFQMSAMCYKAQSDREHREILEACQRRNTSEAVELLAQHIEKAGELLVDFLKQRS